MVVRYLDFVGPIGSPAETDTILPVDANAVLTSTLTLECFQSVCRRDPQIVECRGTVQERELTGRDFPQMDWQSSPCRPGIRTMEEIFGAVLTKPNNHERFPVSDPLAKRLYQYTV